MTDDPDPRFLGGEEAVITDVSRMRWVVAVGWDGAADLHAHVDRATVADEMRYLADHIENATGTTPGPPGEET